jgi:hypothetical protein
MNRTGKQMWHTPQNALPRSRYRDGFRLVAEKEENILEPRTFSVDPQKTTARIPRLEFAASGKPHRRSIVIIIACIHLIFRRVWRGKPTPRALVKSVTCDASSPFESKHSV